MSTLTPVADLDMPAVEEEITTLAGHIAAATARFLELLAAFEAGGGWHGPGLRSCAQWLSWKCGLSTSAAHEHVRVARALTALPAVKAAFAGGEVSFSKARALTRVATPETEAALVETAKACTASQLDRLCSGIAKARPSETVLAHAADARFTASWNSDGTLRFSGRLSPEDGATLLAALAAVRTPDVTDTEAGTDAGRDTGAGLHTDAARADATAADATGQTATVSGETVGGEIGDRLEPELPDDRYRDPAALAARSDARALVLLAAHALSTPPPAVSGDPVRLIVHATAEDLAEAVSPAVRSTGASPSPASDASDPLDTSVTHGHAGDEPDQSSAEESPTVAVLDAGPAVPPLPLARETFERLACEALVEEAVHPDDSARPRAARRFASATQRRALLRRDQGCVFPGCPRRRRLHAHHVIPWSQGGPTTMDNLVLVCEHHHLLLHEGGWRLAADPSGRWIAHGRDGSVLPASPQMSGSARDIAKRHAARIDAGTVTGSWLGDPLHLGYAVACFTQQPSAQSPAGRGDGAGHGAVAVASDGAGEKADEDLEAEAPPNSETTRQIDTADPHGE